MNVSERKRLKQRFLDGIKTPEKLNKKYRYLSPLVLRYIDTIVEEFPKVSEQAIDNLLKVKIKFKNGEKIGYRSNGLEYELPLKLSGPGLMLSIKLFTYNCNEDDVYMNIDDILTFNEPSYSINGEDRLKGYKEQWRYAKTSIHELSHSACHHRLIENGTDENGNRKFICFNGGVPTRIYIIDKNNTLIDRKWITTGLMLHEGITECVAQRIFHSSNFDDYILNGQEKREERYYYYVSYLPLYDMVEIYNLNNKNILSNSYFSDNVSQKEHKKIMGILSDFSKVYQCIMEIKDISKAGQFTDLKIKMSAVELSYQIRDFLKNQKAILFSNMDKDFKVNSFKKFAFYQNQLLEPNTWASLLSRKSYLDESLYSLFFEKFSEQMKEISKLDSTNVEKLKNEYFASKEQTQIE